MPARMLWLVLWGSLAYFAVQAANRTSQGLHDMIAGMASGEPGWVASIDRGAAALLAHHGLQASIVLAVMLAIIAIGVFLPAPAARAAVVLAIVVAAVIWIAGQDFGAIFTGSGTDPNSGLLLALLAVAYWPARTTTGDEDAFHPTTCEAREPGASGTVPVPVLILGGAATACGGSGHAGGAGAAVSSPAPPSTAQQDQGMTPGLPFVDPPDLNTVTPPNRAVHLTAEPTRFDVAGKNVWGESYNGSFVGGDGHRRGGAARTRPVAWVSRQPSRRVRA